MSMIYLFQGASCACLYGKNQCKGLIDMQKNQVHISRDFLTVSHHQISLAVFILAKFEHQRERSHSRDVFNFRRPSRHSPCQTLTFCKSTSWSCALATATQRKSKIFFNMVDFLFRLKSVLLVEPSNQRIGKPKSYGARIKVTKQMSVDSFHSFASPLSDNSFISKSPARLHVCAELCGRPDHASFQLFWHPIERDNVVKWVSTIDSR